MVVVILVRWVVESSQYVLIFVIVDENQRTKDPLQMPIGPITRARVKKLQEAFNGLVKEFIWANPASKSNQAIEGIGVNKEVQKLMHELLQQTLGIQY